MTREEFESKPVNVQYREILFDLPISDALDWVEDCRGLMVKLPEMREVYYSRHNL